MLVFDPRYPTEPTGFGPGWNSSCGRSHEQLPEKTRGSGGDDVTVQEER